jgi:hypothetical protein
MRTLAATVASVAIVLAWPASAMALDGPSPTCNQGSCVGWFNGAGVPVAVSWSAPAGASLTACQFDTITADTPGTNVSCGAYYAAQQQTVTVTVTVRRDTTPPQVTTVAPGRAPDANGWYNHAVALTFAGSDATSGIASCDAPTYSGPDSGSATVAGVCRDVAGNTSAPLTFALKYDATAPAAGASLARGPDANGWYSKPITVSFAGSDATSGIASCTAPATYTGPDVAAASVVGNCTDAAGNRTSAAASFPYDSTAPSAVAVPDRPPDANGWYSKPVSIAFKGNDGVSGVASCTPPIHYARPDGADVKATGTCRDEAGNVSSQATMSFKFDATPPTAPAVKIVAGGGSVTLEWTSATGATSYEVLRELAAKRGRASVLWRGTGRRFVDHSVKNGTHYRYVVRARDQAGNTADRSVDVTPLPPVFAPAPGTVTHLAPLVRWVADPKARFYNVQVYRGRTKVLSRWPTSSPFRIPRSWVFSGRRVTLEPGTYRVFVWPAFGSTKHPRYGKLLGQTSFVWKA